MRAQTWVIGALTVPDSPKRWEKDKLFSCKEPGGCERGGKGEEGSCVKLVCREFQIEHIRWGGKGGKPTSKLQSLHWKPISLECGFWQQTWDLPSTHHHQISKAGNNTGHSQVLLHGCLLGCVVWEAVSVVQEEKGKLGRRGSTSFHQKEMICRYHKY